MMQGVYANGKIYVDGGNTVSACHEGDAGLTGTDSTHLMQTPHSRTRL